jgi:Kef-type K+ transport system membrane component KefB
VGLWKILNTNETIICNATLQLGAFLAGAILAETNFRTQIEADIRPFRGLLLGLFFLTTGTSIDMQVNMIIIYDRYDIVTLSFFAALVINWSVVSMHIWNLSYKLDIIVAQAFLW